MDKLEVLFADNRAIICFYLSIAGFLVLYSKMTDIHIRSVFCLSRKRNMEYVRKQGLFFVVCFSVAEILLYELLSLVRGYSHITPVLAVFFFVGAALVVFWSDRCTVGNDVVQVLTGLCLLFSTPFIIMLAILKWHVTFDRYLGYVIPVLLLFAAGQYKRFVDGWRKGDLA